MMNPDELYAQAQALRARAGELEQHAQQIQRAAQLRYQAQQLTAQADQIATEVAARHALFESAPAAVSTAAPEQAEKPAEALAKAASAVHPLDLTNPDDIARYVALAWPQEGNKNAA